MEAPEPAYPPALDQLLDYRARLLERLEAQPAEFAAVVGSMPADEWHSRRDAGGRTISSVLTEDFSRVSGKLASEIIQSAGLSPRSRGRVTAHTMSAPFSYIS